MSHSLHALFLTWVVWFVPLVVHVRYSILSALCFTLRYVIDFRLARGKITRVGIVPNVGEYLLHTVK